MKHVSGPPDGGWGYAIVLGMMQSQMLFGLVVRSFGVIYLITLERYQTSATIASWVGATNVLVWGACCPVASMLCERLSCRVTSALGSVLLFLGFFVTAFASAVWMLYLSFGILCGAGCACLSTSGYLMVSQYFVKKRALATSLGSMGGSVGVMFMPPLVNTLNDYYGFRGCMLILAAISLQGLVSAALFRTLPPHKPNPSAAVQTSNTDTAKHVLPEETHNTLASKYTINHSADEQAPKESGKEQTVNPSAAAQKHQVSTENAYTKSSHTELDTIGPGSPLLLRNIKKGKKHLISGERLAHLDPDERPSLLLHRKKYLHQPHLTDSMESGLNIDLRIMSHSTDIGPVDKDVSIPNVNRNKIPAANGGGFSLLSLLASEPVLCGVLLMNFSIAFCASSMSTFMPALAVDYGVSKRLAVLLLSYSGAVDSVGRVCLGVIMDLSAVRPQRVGLYAVSGCLASAAVLVIPLYGRYWWYCVWGVLYSMFVGTILAQRTTILADVIGMERMPVLFGLIQTCNASGLTLSRVIGGVLKDSTGLYDYIFYISGALSLLSGLLMFPLIGCSRRQQQT